MVDYLPIRRLVWDEWNLEHITKHGVTPSEVETVIDNEERRLVLIKTYKGRLQVLGQSASGRILSVIIGPDHTRATGTF